MMAGTKLFLTHGGPSSLGIAPCIRTVLSSSNADYLRLLDSDRLGQVAREINVETLGHSQPVGHQLERNNVEQTLQNIAGLGNLDTLSLISREFGVTSVADDNRSARSSNDYSMLAL